MCIATAGCVCDIVVKQSAAMWRRDEVGSDFPDSPEIECLSFFNPSEDKEM